MTEGYVCYATDPTVWMLSGQSGTADELQVHGKCATLVNLGKRSSRPCASLYPGSEASARLPALSNGTCSISKSRQTENTGQVTFYRGV